MRLAQTWKNSMMGLEGGDYNFIGEYKSEHGVAVIMTPQGRIRCQQSLHRVTVV